MKLHTKILTFSFLAIFSVNFVFTQNHSYPVDEETNLITYQEVVEEEGDKNTFFNRAVGWINEYYTNPVNVTKTRDPESGIIKGLHRLKLKETDADGNVMDAGTIQYRFTLEFKDGRYRYTLTEFVLRRGSKIPVEKWLNKPDPSSKDKLKQIDDFAQSWIVSLKEGMKPEPEKEEDEW